MKNQILDIILKSADEGERHAQASIGDCLLQLPGNDELARLYFLKSAETNSPNGMFGAGRCLLMGIGGPRDMEKGLELLGGSASYGQPSAVRLLLEGYGHGQYGINPNPTMATLLTANASMNSMPDIPKLPNDWTFWGGVSARALAEPMIKVGIGAFWSGPVYSFMAAISWRMDVTAPNFEYMARLAAERGCSAAADVMASKTQGATREFWLLLAERPDSILIPADSSMTVVS